MNDWERKQKEYKDWLSTLKVDDEVAVNVGGWNNVKGIVKIIRETPKRLYVSGNYCRERCFNKDNGNEIPQEKYNSSKLIEVTDKVRYEIFERNTRSWFNNFKQHKVDINILKAMRELYFKMEREKKNG